MPARLVVLASGAGTTLQAILDDAELRPLVVAAGTDLRGCPAMARAAEADIPTFAVPPTAYADRDSWNRVFADAIGGHRPDLVVCAGFMRLLAPQTVSRFRMVNTHPSLLPAFPGAHAIRDTLARGVKISGVTVHWVDAGVDTGPIIAQAAVPVEDGDDLQTLRARIQTVEKPLFVETIRRLAKEML